MQYFNEALKAKLQTLLGERGTGNDAAVRRKEINAILEKAAALAVSKAEKAVMAKTKEAISAVESLRASMSEDETAIDTTDAAQRDLLLEAMSQLFQWNGSSYTFRPPAIETANMVEDAVNDTVRATDVLPGSITTTAQVDLFKIFVNREAGYPIDFDIDCVFSPNGNSMFVLMLYRIDPNGFLALIEENVFIGIGGRMGEANFSATDFGDTNSGLTPYLVRGRLVAEAGAGGFESPVLMKKISIIASKTKR